jgi:Na+-driven multidrug efflux pump
MVRSIVAALASLALNFWLVPRLGAPGAAVSMVASQTVAQLLLNACFAESRPLFAMQCRAFVPWWRR